MNKLLTGILLRVISPLALAHPGHGLNSVYAGFMHPLTGWDHLLVMVAVGLWAGKLGGKARWQLPATFLIMMAVGVVLGAWGLAFSGLDSAIAASVMAMGLLLIISMPIQLAKRVTMIAMFALLHGMAHGVELPQTSLLMLTGMLATTALLHLIGLVLSSKRLVIQQSIFDALGLLMLGFGGYLLLS